ncbi:MAG TPA: transcription elongation factor GreA [Polyangiales bacterium]|nr:transcription elongation factor GreA [Polyangiales bacterium]
MDRYPMTLEGHQALTVELKQLQSVDRHQISKEIGIAREHGDLKENAEYHAAKEKQGLIEARIAHLEGMLSRAEVIDSSQMHGDRVKFGASITLEDVESGETKTFRIVGPEEADIANGTISVTAPMARACINHEVGDEVRVRAPSGPRNYQIVDLKWK